MNMFWYLVMGVAAIWLWRRHHHPTHPKDESKVVTTTPKSPSVPQNEQPSQPVPTGRWYDKSVSIHGFILPRGMVYGGNGLPDMDRSGITQREPSLLNPLLPVDKTHPDRMGTTLTYWPGYDRITPQARAAYLEFLAGGANLPETNIGYVFIYYYGLERRLLLDLAQEQEQQERMALIQEILRLLGLFGANPSFSRYVGNLLNYLALKHDLLETLNLTPLLQHSPDIIWTLLAKSIQQGKNLDADLALKWLALDPEFRPRTPAKRLPEAFLTLFQALFDQIFPEGMKFSPSKSRLTVTYAPASSALAGQPFQFKSLLPDMSRHTKHLPKLREIAERCMDEMDPYSRLLARDAPRAQTLAGLALLPPPLLRDKLKEKPLNPFLSMVKSALDGKQRVVLPAKQILNHWPLSNPNTVTRQDALLVAQLLAKFKVGMEPDVRFGSKAIQPDGPVCLFRMSERGGQSASPAFTSATNYLHLAVLMALADGTVDHRETWHIEQHLMEQTDLEPYEKERLTAHLAWLIASNPKLDKLKSHLQKLDAKQARLFGRALIFIAMADDNLDPAEIALLEKIYTMARLNPALVQQDLAELHPSAKPDPVTTDDLEVFTLVDAPGPREYRLPQPTAGSLPSDATKADLTMTPLDSHPPVPDEPIGVSLDLGKLRATREQSQEVQEILMQIFSQDDEEPAHPPALPEPSDLPAIAGLSGNHLHLFHALRERATMAREAYNDLCRKLGLMPDGAMEVLNDAAYNLLGDPVLDGEDPLEMDLHVAKEMMS